MSDLFLSAWSVLFTLFLAFILFGITVFVHEFGHFIVARKCGLIVQTFSIGFGKALWQRKKNGITYKIGWIPFGGYVSLPQLDPAGMEKVQGKGNEEALPPVSPWKKIAVAVSGPLGNVLLAILLAWIIFLGSDQPIIEESPALIGIVDEDSEAYAKGVRAGDVVVAVNEKPVRQWADFLVEGLLAEDGNGITVTLQSSNQVKVVTLVTVDPEETGQIVDGVKQAIPCLLGMIQKDSPADRAGLRANDMVQSFDGTPVDDWRQFTELVQNAGEREVPITVSRRGVFHELSITPTYQEEYERVMVGVGLGTFRRRPMEQVKSDASMIFRTLKGLVTPKESAKIAGKLQGPIGIFDLLMTGIQAGLFATLGLIRFLNINLAILNLLPIPVLDGGHICFSLWEGITCRRVNAKMQAALIQTFALILISLMLFLSVKDIGRKLDLDTLFEKKPAGQQVESEPAGE
jgi:regulator of sigma E protease